MGNETRLKIILLGPVSSGKTTISNFLSESTENFAGENRSTKGVRIVEFVAQGVRGKGLYQNSVEVELWDCSGDVRYRPCWPAIQYKADGIIYVYSENSNKQKSDLDTFYSFFTKQSDFPESCCLIVKNQFGEELESKNSGNPLPDLNHVLFNLEGKEVEFKKNFNSFLSTIIKTKSND